jgi:hypothetical protein
MTNVVVVQSITNANNRLNILTAPDVVTGRAVEISEPFGEIRCGERIITSFLGAVGLLSDAFQTTPNNRSRPTVKSDDIDRSMR